MIDVPSSDWKCAKLYLAPTDFGIWFASEAVVLILVLCA